MRPAGVDRLAIDAHEAEPAGRAAGKPGRGEFGALDDEQRGDLVVAVDLDRDVLAEPAAVFAGAARTRAQPLVADEDRVLPLGNLDRGRRDVRWPGEAVDAVLVRPRA